MDAVNYYYYKLTKIHIHNIIYIYVFRHIERVEYVSSENFRVGGL